MTTTSPAWLEKQAGDMTHLPPLMPPTGGEVEALSRELTEPSDLPTTTAGLRDLRWRAALMIARLERAWLEAQACAGRQSISPVRPLAG